MRAVLAKRHVYLLPTMVFYFFYLDLFIYFCFFNKNDSLFVCRGYNIILFDLYGELCFGFIKILLLY